jgi:hypothetical protein
MKFRTKSFFCIGLGVQFAFLGSSRGFYVSTFHSLDGSQAGERLTVVSLSRKLLTVMAKDYLRIKESFDLMKTVRVVTFQQPNERHRVEPLHTHLGSIADKMQKKSSERASLMPVECFT